MRYWIPYIVCFLIIVSAGRCDAQEQWPSPEVGQMYRHALQYMAMGNYNDAITTSEQALLLAPGNALFEKILGKAQFMAGDYRDAEATLNRQVRLNHDDTATYQLIARCRFLMGDYKSANRALSGGIEKFPHSGLLYHERGFEYQERHESEDALTAWLKGIEANPLYAGNYFDAASTFFNSEDALWGLIYGEEYLILSIETAANDTMKRMLFAGYKKYFDRFAADNNREKHLNNLSAFEVAVNKIFSELTPVVSDGISTENLAMARTRFAMEWSDHYAGKYPFPLFSYWEILIRNGRFEIYNEWLFGRAESETEFRSWNIFHPGDIDRFMEWRRDKLLKPTSGDHYNSRNFHMPKSK